MREESALELASGHLGGCASDTVGGRVAHIVVVEGDPWGGVWGGDGYGSVGLGGLR